MLNLPVTTVTKHTRGSPASSERLNGWQTLSVVDPRLDLPRSHSQQTDVLVISWHQCRKAIVYMSDSSYHMCFAMWGGGKTVLSVRGPLNINREREIKQWLGYNGDDYKAAKQGKADYQATMETWLTNPSAWMHPSAQDLGPTWPHIEDVEKKVPEDEDVPMYHPATPTRKRRTVDLSSDLRDPDTPDRRCRGIGSQWTHTKWGARAGGSDLESIRTAGRPLTNWAIDALSRMLLSSFEQSDKAIWVASLHLADPSVQQWVALDWKLDEHEVHELQRRRTWYIPVLRQGHYWLLVLKNNPKLDAENASPGSFLVYDSAPQYYGRHRHEIYGQAIGAIIDKLRRVGGSIPEKNFTEMRTPVQVHHNSCGVHVVMNVLSLAESGSPWKGLEDIMPIRRMLTDKLSPE